MKSVIKKTKNNNNTAGLMFVNLTILSRYTHDELIVINTVILAGVSVIIISYYFKKLIDKLI